MAAEHLNAAELEAAVRGSLPPPELLRASDHIASCPQCRAHARELTGTRSWPPGEEKISYEALADYLDDKLDPLRRAEVEEQLRRSPRAAADLASLANFREETNRLKPALTKNDSGAKIRPFPTVVARWILPLAAVLLVAIGGVWWGANSRRHTELVGRHELQTLAPDLRAAVLAAEHGKLPIPPEVTSLGGRPEKLAGAPGELPGFQLVEPKATAVLLTRPRFSWTSRAGASGYRVLVVDLRSGDLVASGSTTACKWEPPNDLERSQSYQWQVQALRDGKVIERVPRPPEPEARFTILSAEAEREFVQIENKHPDSPFIVAVAAARLGLLDVAEENLRRTQQAKPDSTIPGDLLAQVQAARSSSAR